MKKSILKLITVVVVMVAFSFTAVAQSFEGVIEFKKSSNTDTTSYVYTVKGNQVRIDEIGSKSHKVEGSFLASKSTKNEPSTLRDFEPISSMRTMFPFTVYT